MSAAPDTWPCGHPFTVENTERAAFGTTRCKACRADGHARTGATIRSAGPWGDEAVLTEMKRLHADGYSSSQIVRLLNERFRLTVSRNAVLGIVHRLGLERPAAAKPTLRTVVVKAKIVKNPEGSARHLHARAQTAARLIIAGRGAVHETSADSKPLPPEKPLGEPLVASLMDLKRHHCRWPYGVKTISFCGRMAEGDGPYCKAHGKVAYQGLPGGGRPTPKELTRALRRHI